MTAHDTKARAPRRARACRALLGAAFVALLLALPTAARAQSDAEKTEARQLAIDANAALEQKDYATASDKFARADKLFHAPTLLLGYARAQVGLGRLVTALEAYRRIVSEGVPEGASTQFVEAVEDAKREAAALEQRIPTITLNIVGAPSADVTLDGTPLAPAQIGVRVAVSPGAHVVRATAAGRTPQERSFSIAEGAHEKFALFLEPEGAKPAPGPAPDKGPGAAPALRTVGAVALIVGGIAVVGGGVAGGLAIREHGFLADDCKKNRCPPSRQSTLDNFHTLATLSTIGIIGGGVAAAGGIVLLVAFPAPDEHEATPKRAASRAWIAPTVGLGSAGVAGAF